ncbi:MAG: hypothetical protein GF329_20760 [Candidatus Lokiarchaeota archaeon]|nr:hypothetical protein [Candidatus Lokiarchaeota archaeon]
MVLYKCTRCDWEGPEDVLVMVPICPDCTTGHHPSRRLLETIDKGVLNCPSCSWKGNDPLHEPECPKCGNQYLKEIT